MSRADSRMGRDGPTRLGARIARLLVGLVLFGTGLAFMVIAGLGLAPWDVLHQGLSLHLPITIGQATISTGVLVMLAWIPLGERVGSGTVANVLVIGTSLDVALWCLPGSLESLWARLLSLGFGLLLVGLGSGLYIGAELGPGPRDGLMTGLARRGIPLRWARLSIEVGVLMGGWLLGGSIGVGTAVFAVAIGPLVQHFLRRLALPGSPWADGEA